LPCPDARETTEAPTLQARNLDHQFGDHLVAVETTADHRRKAIAKAIRAAITAQDRKR
jgi:hypothetical protein